jgi:cellulose synthase (UDP-forming)
MKRRVLYVLTIITTLIYLVWRGIYTLPVNESLFALIFGILLWISEIISNFTAVFLIWSKNSAEPLIEPEIAPSKYPDVDVLIATHNETPELLAKTINSATRMHYPDKSKVHIYIADDNERVEMAELAAKFGIGYLGVKNNKHAKSGNFNYAIANSYSPLVATFDADMIPYADFLTATVPFFVDNAKRRRSGEDIKPLGLVQTPQSFYNADSFQFNLFSEVDIPNEQDFFSREVNVYHNAHGAAIYTGSNTLIDRQAILDAGGFPTNTITEDFQLGAQMNMAGYQNISTLEPKASGLTPTDIPSILKQRIRWGRGVVQSVYNIRAFTNPKLTWAQRFVYINSYLYWWSFFRRILYIFAPILFTVFGIRVVDTNFWILLAIWLPSYALIQLVMKDVSSDLRTSRWGEIQETIFAPYLVVPIFMQSIGLKERSFKVTNKNANQSRKDKLYALPNAIMLGLALYGLVIFNYGKFGSEIAYGAVITFWLLSHIVNLSFAVLYYLGRPIYRAAERFAMSIDIEVSSHGTSNQFVTNDISETGLSFKTDYPIYYPADEDLHFTLHKGENTTSLVGRIVRVWKSGTAFYYGVELNEETSSNEAAYITYLQIIYDGFNKSLRQTMDPMTTIIDAFLINLDKHLQPHQQPGGQASQALYPVIHTNQIITDEGHSYQVDAFDFATLTFSQLDTAITIMPRKSLSLMIDEVLFDLSYLQKNASGKLTYQVDNMLEIAYTENFKKLLAKWVQHDQLITQQSIEEGADDA